MKIVDKIASLPADQPFYTFEFFPPRTDQGTENLLARISRLLEAQPLAINITWGAGGTTKDRSLDLAGTAQKQFSVDTVLHLTCTNIVQGGVDEALKNATSRGIQNILALRGDPPRGSEHWIPTDPRFTHARDLVAYIRETHPDLCIGVAGYPDGHPDQVRSEDEELDFLKEKIDAGAEYIATQLFYDAASFVGWVRKVRDKGITVPIIAGVMPIQSYASFLRLTKLCGSKVPREVLDALEPIKNDDQRVKEYGVALATDIITHIVQNSEVRGFHFCTLNLEKSVRSVLESLGWTGRFPKTPNMLISDDISPAEEAATQEAHLQITPIAASQTAKSSLSVKPAPAKGPGEAGKGELNNASTWDEFPNGRFSDVKSPAFGAGVDLWTSGVVKPLKTASRWAGPSSEGEITSLFLSYLQAHSNDSFDSSLSPTTPFTSERLSQESLTILPHLVDLTKKGWWTVGSQPAVDAAPSSDEVVGWGPPGGWVFQKAFVEFFTDDSVVIELEALIKENGEGWVTFFAADGNGEFKTNMDATGRNAVTWGAFRGHEIEQSTIIDRESFSAWKEEAFDMWSQWSTSFPPDSSERTCLDRVRESKWLISIVHHNYKEENALWEFLKRCRPT